MSVLGIDFGTDSCYVSVARAGGIETIANDYSLRSTPSCASFGERTRSMGVAARNQQTTNMKNTVFNFKRFLGRQFRDPLVQEELKRDLPFDVVEQTDGSVGIKVRYQNEEQIFSAEQITAMMFTKLKDIADAAVGAKTIDCVLSTPSYFTDAERRALLDAASIAGFNVLKLMNDSTAVALAYGLYKQDLPAAEEKPRNVFFVDFGYASLQVYAASFNRGKLKMLACVSDPNLGGRDFDLALAENFRQDFIKKYKLDVGTNKRAWLRLNTEVAKLKKQMSANSTQLPFGIECLMDDVDMSSTMKRADFEELIAPLLQRIQGVMRQALQESGLKADDVYAVELVGGSTRIPVVKNIIKDVYGVTPSTTLNQDEAVSRGCALQCAMLSPAFKVREFSISDIQIYPVVLKWRGPNQKEGHMEVFPKYHSVPFSKMLTFYRTDAFTLEAYYDGDVPIANKFIGQYRIQNVKPLPTGESSKVKVKARVNLHGIFIISSASLMEPVTKEEESMDADAQSAESKGEEPKSPSKMENGADAKEPEKMETEPADADKKDSKEEKEDKKSKKPAFRSVDLPIESHVFQLSRQRLDEFHEVEMKLIANDRMEKERADARNAVEEYVYDMRDKIGGVLEEYFPEQERSTFRKSLDEMENWLYEDGEDCAKNVYVDKLRQLHAVGDPAAKRKREFEERPRALDELGGALQLCRKALDMYANKDERYEHIDAADMEKVAKAVAEKEQWLDTALSAAAGTPKHVDPPILVQMIRHEKQALDSLVTPILNKPKPKPKVETPPEEPAKSAEQNNQDPKAAEANTAGATGDRPSEMEVDS